MSSSSPQPTPQQIIDAINQMGQLGASYTRDVTKIIAELSTECQRIANECKSELNDISTSKMDYNNVEACLEAARRVNFVFRNLVSQMNAEFSKAAVNSNRLASKYTLGELGSS